MSKEQYVISVYKLDGDGKMSSYPIGFFGGVKQKGKDFFINYDQNPLSKNVRRYPLVSWALRRLKHLTKHWNFSGLSFRLVKL